MSADAPNPVQASRSDWMGLLAISLGVSLVVVDFTIVNVIIPPIVEDLDISSLDAQWIQESYAIALAALLLVMGRLSDIWGPVGSSCSAPSCSGWPASPRPWPPTVTC